MLLTLEGLDGSGKTTAWEALRDGATTGDSPIPEDAVFTAEPTDSWYGDAVNRSLADDDADPLAELFLYTADHAAHLSETVRPALAAGRTVVSDRYADSRYAYQGVSLSGHIENPMAYVRAVHEPWTRPPDATLYLDVDPDTAAERSGAGNKFETAEHLSRVRERYEQLVATEPDRFVRIDATQSPGAVRDDVLAAVSELVS